MKKLIKKTKKIEREGALVTALLNKTPTAKKKAGIITSGLVGNTRAFWWSGVQFPLAAVGFFLHPKK